MPGSVDDAIKAARRPAEDWRATLREFVEPLSPSDFSLQHPIRALLPGAWVAGVKRESLPALHVYVDTSGSTGPDAPAFGAEIGALLHEARPDELVIVYCDTKITRIDRFGPDDDFEFRYVGGGGTELSPPFEWARSQGETPAAAIYLTDLEADYPAEAPYPVLWVTTARSTRVAPWGRTVRVLN